MSSWEAAQAYLSQNPLLYLNMLELLRRGSGAVHYARADGVLLRDGESGAWFLSAGGEEALACMESLLPPDTGLLVGHELWYKDRLRARFPAVRGEQICVQSAWLESMPPELPPSPAELRLLDQSWTKYVFRHYSHAFAEEAYIAGVIRRGMLGAFVGNTLAGFVGTHEEGTIGLLEVLPAYRRRGLGELLLRAVVRRVLAGGGYAFGQVEVDNAPSLALQRRAGMTLSTDRLYWLVS